MKAKVSIKNTLTGEIRVASFEDLADGNSLTPFQRKALFAHQVMPPVTDDTPEECFEIVSIEIVSIEHT